MRARPRNVSDSWKADYWNKIEQVQNDTGLDFTSSIDDIEMKPMDSLASMERRRYEEGSGYEKNILNLSSEFDYLDPSLQEHVLSHEGIHALDFDSKLIPELKNSRGISDQAAIKLSALKDQSMGSKEGVTQAINKRVSPNPNSNYFYPDETRQVESMLQEEGTDLDSELLEDMNRLEEQVVDEYREIDSKVEIPGLYLEYGSFNDADYSAMVIGKDAEKYGESIVGDYLADEGLLEVDYSDFKESSLDSYEFLE